MIRVRDLNRPWQASGRRYNKQLMGDNGISTWQAMIAGAPFGVVRVDSSGVVRYANGTALDLLGEGLLDRPWAWHMAGADAAAGATKLSVSGRDDQPLYCWRRQGEAREVWWWLAAASDLLDDGDRLWRGLVAALCHDLRSPLAVVMGFCELLQLDHAEHSEFGPALERMHRAASAIQDRLDAEQERVSSRKAASSAVCGHPGDSPSAGLV